jgi:hypothetical protein
MIGLTALLNLVAIAEKLQHQPFEEKGNLCSPTSSPPAHRPERDGPVVAQASSCQSASPPVAARAAAGAPIGRVPNDLGGQP